MTVKVKITLEFEDEPVTLPMVLAYINQLEVDGSLHFEIEE